MNHIDKIIYINLDKRTDRRENLENELNRLNVPKEKVIRLKAVEDADGPVGCCLSHVKALEMAHSLKLETVLVLEDDFVFVSDKDHVNTCLEHIFEKITDWEAVLLTGCHGASPGEIKYVDEVVQICHNSTNGAGYLVKQPLFLPLSRTMLRGATMLKLTKQTWLYTNDVIWREHMTNNKWLAFINPLGYQKPGFSDINKTDVDHSYGLK